METLSQEEQPILLQVASKSNPTSVAGAITRQINLHGYVDLRYIGAGAGNQAIKAITIARGLLVTKGLDLTIVPSFVTITIEGQEKTGILFHVGACTK